MAGNLAAEHGTGGAHAGLEERVAHAVDQRGAARGLDGVLDRPRGADVVEDRGAGLLLEDRLREHRGEEVAGDELAGVVDEEAAVGVAVPGDPELGLPAGDLGDDLAAVLLEQRVGADVGELAVGDPVALDQVEREVVEQRADHGRGHAVGGVDDDAARLDLVGLHECERGGLELGVDVDVLDGSAARGRVHALLDQPANVLDALVAGEGKRALADELDAGVGLGVVRGGANRASRSRPSRRRRPSPPRPSCRRGKRRPSRGPAGACRARGRCAARTGACRRGRRARARRRGRSGARCPRPAGPGRCPGCRRP